MKATKKRIAITMASATLALGAHANDEAARTALADMADEFPNHIITMAYTWDPFHGMLA